MNHPNRALRAAPLAALAAILLASSLPAQEPKPPAIARIEGTRAAAYRLQYADPVETRGLLTSLFQSQGDTPGEPIVRITADTRTNTLIALAPEAVHRHITDLLTTLDVKIDDSRSRGETRIFRLQHRTVDAVLEVAALHNVQTARNDATNSIIARGPVGEIERLAETIAALDVDTPSIEVEGWILEQGHGKQVEEHPDLAPLAGDLVRGGLEGYGVLSQWSVRSLAGEGFRSEQSFGNRRVNQISVEGSARPIEEGKSVQVRISINVAVQFGEPGAPNDPGNIQLDTVLETQPGKLVVVGLAPTGDEKSRPLVIVLRVSE